MTKPVLNSLHILVVDDEAAMRTVLEMRLKSWGCVVETAENGRAALDRLNEFKPEIILSDVSMPAMNGLELLGEVKRSADGNHASPAVILLTAQGSIDLAVEAMKRGALDFITKPLDYDKLRLVLESAAHDILLRRKTKEHSAKQAPPEMGTFVGSSKVMKELYEFLQTLAVSDTSVFITGESGTGKELAARALHSLSSRAHGPFVAVNSSAIPESLMESELFGHEKGSFTGAIGTRMGCFEMAQHGTLLLDEIAEMPLALQPKLLRVLEDRRVRKLGGAHEFPIDVRVLAATNRPPAEAIKAGLLREDLYYRLNVFTVFLPPLREHPEDIPELLQHFINELNEKHKTTLTVPVVAARPETLELLARYDWPGNVREFRNVTERAVVLARGEWIEPAHLPPYIRDSRKNSGGDTSASATADNASAASILRPGTTAADAERELILRTLEETGNNKSETARRLGLDVKTIRNKLKSYGIM
jgi:DNA-binding NtrC family response regulator